MSLKAGCEIIVLLESFKNIDLTTQGLFCLELHIQKSNHEKSQETILGQPYMMAQVAKELRSRKKNKVCGEPQIYDTDYLSKTFLIKYNDQQIDLEQAVVFRLQLNYFPDIEDDNIDLVLTLNHKPNDSQTPKGNVGSASFQFKKVSTCRVRLNNIETGICDYIRTCFDSKYLAQVSFCVFSLVMDCKFRMYSCKRKEKTEDDIEREHIDNMSDFYAFANRKIANGMEHFYTRYIKHVRYHSYVTKNKWGELATRPISNTICIPNITEPEGKYEGEIQATPQQFFKYFSDFKPKNNNFSMFQQEIYNICVANHKFLQQFVERIHKNEIKINLLKQRYIMTMKERCGQFIFRNNCGKQQIGQARSIGPSKQSFAKRIRKKSHFLSLNLLNLQDMALFPDFQQQPLMFHDITTIQQTVQRPKSKFTLFVLVHGFQGSTNDVRKIRNNLKQFYPNAFFLMSKSNQTDTLCDISRMGQKLAQQVKQYVKQYEIDKDMVLHMVGHSLGGIIIRASLQHLKSFNLGTFVSFSSPHLGYLYGTRPYIQTGLWFLKKFKKTYSLQQLTMDDSKSLEDTFMFRLAQSGSLRNFRKVVLISSYEDKYVPWHSARIQSYKGEAVQRKTCIENAMIRSLLDNVRLEEVHRVDISYEISEKNIDSMLGRTAHIQFLENQTVLKMIFFCLPEIFS